MNTLINEINRINNLLGTNKNSNVNLILEIGLSKLIRAFIKTGVGTLLKGEEKELISKLFNTGLTRNESKKLRTFLLSTEGQNFIKAFETQITSLKGTERETAAAELKKLKARAIPPKPVPTLAPTPAPVPSPKEELLGKALEEFDLTNLSPKQLTNLERFLARNPAFFAKIKNITTSMIKSWIVIGKNMEKGVDDVYSKLYSIINETKHGLREADSFTTEFNDINSSLLAMKSTKGFQDWSRLYGVLKQKFISQGLDMNTTIAVIESLKKSNPFIRTYYKSKQPSDFWKAISESSIGGSYRDIMKMFNKKERDFLSFLNRVTWYSMTGSFKTGKDWAYFFDKYGPKKGFIKTYLWAQAASKIGLPIVVSIWGLFIRLIQNTNINRVPKNYGNLAENYSNVLEKNIENAFYNPELGVGSNIVRAAIPIRSMVLSTLWSLIYYGNLTSEGKLQISKTASSYWDDWVRKNVTMTDDDFKKLKNLANDPETIRTMTPPQQSGQQKPTTPPTGTQPVPPQQSGQQQTPQPTQNIPATDASSINIDDYMK
jgi:hypothetical protein